MNLKFSKLPSDLVLTQGNFHGYKGNLFAKVTYWTY